MATNVLGISCLYHSAACCLIQDGILKAAAEERFSRIKADSSMPVYAIKYCLKEAELSLSDIDCFAYYELPEKKLARQLWSGYWKDKKAAIEYADMHSVERRIRELVGYEGPVAFFDHHLSHAASSYYFSGFSDAAILTVDGVGEWATTTYGLGVDKKVELFEEVHFPDSLGLLYSTITS